MLLKIWQRKTKENIRYADRNSLILYGTMKFVFVWILSKNRTRRFSSVCDRIQLSRIYIYVYAIQYNRHVYRAWRRFKYGQLVVNVAWKQNTFFSFLSAYVFVLFIVSRHFNIVSTSGDAIIFIYTFYFLFLFTDCSMQLQIQITRTEMIVLRRWDV